MEFTHQGAEWTDESCQIEVPFSQDMMHDLERPLTDADPCRRRKGIQVIAGKFGVYDKQVPEEDA